MQSAKKGKLVTALIGGAAALLLAFFVRKVMKPEKKRRCKIRECLIENT